MNTEFKGTKTEWVISDYIAKNKFGDYYISIGIEESKKWIEVHGAAYRNNQELAANALLISHAPAMLQMLQKVSQAFKDANMPAAAIEIDQLINQATTL